MAETTKGEHLLAGLSLPSRYEPLVARIGPEVLNLLVPPATATLDVLEEAGEAVRSLGEGLFLPIYAESGTGKTTLAENLTVFLGTRFTGTLTYTGAVTADAMQEALDWFIADSVAPNDLRVIPINVDHREGRPPTPAEVSEIKRFLRAGLGQRVLLIWPETTESLAREMAKNYRQIAGVVPLDLPVSVAGPAPDTWTGLAAQTLQLANQVDSLDELVDFGGYDVGEFHSLGDFLKQIAIDFNRQRLAMVRATKKPVELTILFVSETAGHGILSTLTSSRRFGMLDPSALIQACSDSVIGQWWDGHRGLLVQTIVALDAHAFSVSPTLSLAVLRRYGPADVQDALAGLGYTLRTPGEVSTYLNRSDFGRRLAGQQRAVAEGRGNPAEEARVVFETFQQYVGFQSARDKQMNQAFAEAIRFLYSKADKPPTVQSEKGLPFLSSLIPDLSVVSDDQARCIEFTYRKGDFLHARSRSVIAQYCLTKLKNYARGVGWLAADA